MIRARVGGVAMAFEGGAQIERALRDRFAGFVDGGDGGDGGDDADADLRFVVDAATAFDPAVVLDGPQPLGATSEGRGNFRIVGPARGTLSLARHRPGRLAGEGTLEGARHLGDVDALVRLALALVLPRAGALLVHAACVPTRGARGPAAVVLAGASTMGKSTAARALGPALADELVVLHCNNVVHASGTPWWRGRAERLPVACLGVLGRSPRAGDASARPLAGGRAARTLLPHVVRYVVDAETDALVLSLVAAACAARPVHALDAPEGDGFVPWLRGAIDHVGRVAGAGPLRAREAA